MHGHHHRFSDNPFAGMRGGFRGPRGRGPGGRGRGPDAPPPVERSEVAGWFAGRPLVGGEPAAYVCRGFVCSAPVTDVSALGAAMAPS